MIFRRLGEAIRAQDWSTIGVELLIVVVGVFLGIQVANWNEDWQDRDAERVIVQRLSDEVRSLTELQQAERTTVRERADLVISAHPVLFGQEPSRELTTGECEEVGGSHAYRPPSDQLPVLDEIRESDRFDLLTDPELRERLRDYILFRERARGRYAESINELFRLYDLHPDVIWIERVPTKPDDTGRWTFLAGEGYRWNVVCDVDGMRDSRAFLSHYADNAARLNSLLTTYDASLELLRAIEVALDGIPGARSASGKPPS